MIAKFLLLTLAACLPLFSAPDDTRAADVRKTIQGLKNLHRAVAGPDRSSRNAILFARG